MAVTIVVDTAPYGTEGPFNASRLATIHDLAELVKKCDKVICF